MPETYTIILEDTSVGKANELYLCVMHTPEILPTNDGSHTLVSATVKGELYHSTHGAIQEAQHIFINGGLRYAAKPQLHVLELGFGTGLNALLTWLEAERMGIQVYYETVELYPIPTLLASQLNYSTLLGVDKERYFVPLHTCEWGTDVALAPCFTIRKQQGELADYQPIGQAFDVVYFDAFAPDVQPQLWSVEVFSTIYEHMAQGGVLLTYSAKGMVKENLRKAGFSVSRLAGPVGKRHIIRATKDRCGE